MQKAILVPFNGKSITAFMNKGEPVVAMKSICENMGLQWEAQLKRIKRHPVLVKGVSMMDIPSSGGEQQTMCLPLSMLNGWLFGIDASRVKPEIKDSVIAYQTQCFKVLADYFGLGGQNRSASITDKRQAHNPMMDALIEQREELGKKTMSHHFITENRLCNWSVTGSFEGINESEMTLENIQLLAYARRTNESLIMAGVDYDERKRMLAYKVENKRKKLIKLLA